MIVKRRTGSNVEAIELVGKGVGVVSDGLAERREGCIVVGVVVFAWRGRLVGTEEEGHCIGSVVVALNVKCQPRSVEC